MKLFDLKKKKKNLAQVYYTERYKTNPLYIFDNTLINVYDLIKTILIMLALTSFNGYTHLLLLADGIYIQNKIQNAVSTRHGCFLRQTEY